MENKVVVQIIIVVVITGMKFQLLIKTHDSELQGKEKAQQRDHLVSYLT